MFTGIVEETGIIKEVTKNMLSIEADIILNDLQLGDSVAVNGICLTVFSINNKLFNTHKI